MPATTVSLRAANAASENVTTPALPTGTVAGDFILVIVHQPNTATTPAASGYTQLGTYVDSGATSRTTVLYRFATGSDSISLTGTGSDFVTYVSSYVDVQQSGPFAGSAFAQSPGGGPFTCPAVTSSRTGAYLICHLGGATYGGVGAVTWTPPSGMTERVDYSGTSGTFPYANTAADLAGVSGSTSAATFTPTNSAIGVIVGVSLLLAPADTAPTAPTGLNPSGSTTIDLNNTQRFSWTFNDPDTGDTQSKFDLQYRIGTAAWTTVTSTTTNQFYDFAAGTFTANSYEWQVRTYDSIGTVSPWSASAFFTAGTTPGVPTITAPASGGTVSSNSATVSWSSPSQDAYEVRTVADLSGAADTSTIYTDTGNVTDTSARSRTVAFTTNGVYQHVQVRVQSGGLWSAFADIRVLVSYTPPAVPTATITAYSSSAAVTVAWTDPTPTGSEPTVSSHDVWRRESANPSSTTVPLAAAVGGTSWTDYTPASLVDYEYEVVANGTNGTSTASVWTGAATGVSGGAYGGGY